MDMMSKSNDNTNYHEIFKKLKVWYDAFISDNYLNLDLKFLLDYFLENLKLD